MSRAKTVYCFDTSSYIRAWHEAYPPDVVESFWNHLHEAIDDDVVISPDEVLRELKKRSGDGLHNWVKEREDKCIVPIDGDLEDIVAEILEAHPQMAMNRKGATSADPWIVALAKHRGATVVSEESYEDSVRRPKIPGVCKSQSVKCVQLLQFMRDLGWKF